MHVTVDIGQILIGLAVLFTEYQNWQNKRAISDVHKATNSMKDALVETTSRESFARGVRSGEASSMNINHRKDDSEGNS